jgi:hypothetical protein
MEQLVQKIHNQNGEPKAVGEQAAMVVEGVKKRKGSEGDQAIIAASALCQLGGNEDEENEDGESSQLLKPAPTETSSPQQAAV